jgi:hypothetical protein
LSLVDPRNQTTQRIEERRECLRQIATAVSRRVGIRRVVSQDSEGLNPTLYFFRKRTWFRWPIRDGETLCVVVMALPEAIPAQPKTPVPMAEAEQAAKRAAGEIYGGRFKQVKTTAEKTALATEMIEAAMKVEDGSPVPSGIPYGNARGPGIGKPNRICLEVWPV